MLEPMFTMGQVGAKVDGFVFDKNSRMRQALHYVGITFMSNAKSKANFTDRTGNLRSSIGYSLLLDGKVIDEMYDKGDEEVNYSVRKVVDEVLNETEDVSGYILIGFAGMEYAAAVESRGYDVITGSTPMADELLTYFKKELKLV